MPSKRSQSVLPLCSGGRLKLGAKPPRAPGTGCPAACAILEKFDSDRIAGAGERAQVHAEVRIGIHVVLHQRGHHGGWHGGRIPARRLVAGLGNDIAGVLVGRRIGLPSARAAGARGGGLGVKRRADQGHDGKKCPHREFRIKGLIYMYAHRYCRIRGLVCCGLRSGAEHPGSWSGATNSTGPPARRPIPPNGTTISAAAAGATANWRPTATRRATCFRMATVPEILVSTKEQQCLRPDE